MSMQRCSLCAVTSVWVFAHLMGLKMDPTENSNLFCWAVLQMDQLSDQVHCLVAQTAGVAEQRGS